MKDLDKVLVLDTVHGGDYLANELRSLGHESKAIHPYNGETTDITNYDCLVTPVHMYPDCKELIEAEKHNIPTKTHHQTTKYIIERQGLTKDLDIDLFTEITGTVGKTTTSLLLQKILYNEGYNVVSHTSNGLYHNTQDQEITRYSVAPYGTIKALKKIKEKSLDIDIWISEISIGFIGHADIATITSIKEDYKIADETKKASKTKINSIQNHKPNTIINTPKKHPRAKNTKNNIKTDFDGQNLKTKYKAQDINNKTRTGEFTIELPLYPYFKDSIPMTILTAATHGATTQKIKETLNKFNGAPGRMQTKKIKGRTIIDNACAGTRITSLDQYLTDLKQNKQINPDKIHVIVGEDQKNICEEMNYQEVKKTINKHNIKNLTTVGKKYKNLGHNTPNLKKAKQQALKKTNKNDIILNFVKTFR